MNTYLITPQGCLGSDSFHVRAASHAAAIEIAQNTIEKEDWHSPLGWLVLLEVTSFEERGK